jgi:hypothetical protein
LWARADVREFATAKPNLVVWGCVFNQDAFIVEVSPMQTQQVLVPNQI